MPKLHKNRVEFKQEFKTYILWKSLPALLKGKPMIELEKLGIKDEIVLELLNLKTQTEFAEKYNIKDLGTLSDWNKKIEEEELLKNSIKFWAKKLTPNVIAGFYKKAVSEGDAARVKLWHQLIEDWEEKVENRMTGEIKLINDIPRPKRNNKDK